MNYDQPPRGLTQQMQDGGYALLCQAKACSDIEIAVDEVEKLSQIKVMKMPVKVMKLEPLSHYLVSIPRGNQDRQSNGGRSTCWSRRSRLNG